MCPRDSGKSRHGIGVASEWGAGFFCELVRCTVFYAP